MSREAREGEKMGEAELARGVVSAGALGAIIVIAVAVLVLYVMIRRD